MPVGLKKNKDKERLASVMGQRPTQLRPDHLEMPEMPPRERPRRAPKKEGDLPLGSSLVQDFEAPTVPRDRIGGRGKSPPQTWVQSVMEREFAPQFVGHQQQLVVPPRPEPEPTEPDLPMTQSVLGRQPNPLFIGHGRELTVPETPREPKPVLPRTYGLDSDLPNSKKVHEEVKKKGGVVGGTLAGVGTSDYFSDGSLDGDNLPQFGGMGFINLAKGGDQAFTIYRRQRKMKQALEEGRMGDHEAFRREKVKTQGDLAKETISTAKTGMQMTSELGTNVPLAVPLLSTLGHGFELGRQTRRGWSAQDKLNELNDMDWAGNLDINEQGMAYDESFVGEGMLSPHGMHWKARATNRLKTQRMVAALKGLASAAGIVATVALASNPVGWAISIGLAVGTAGVMAGKMVHNYRKNQQKKETFDQLESQAPTLDNVPTEQQKEELRRKAEQVAALCGENARTAQEMVDFLNRGDGARVLTAPTGRAPYEDLAAHDALVLLQVLGIDPKVAVSGGGSKVIEKALSVGDKL